MMDADRTWHDEDRAPASLWSGDRWIYAHSTTDPKTAIEWTACGGSMVVRNPYRFGETVISGRHNIGKDGACLDCAGPTTGPCYRKGWSAWAKLTISEAKAMQEGAL